MFTPKPLNCGRTKDGISVVEIRPPVLQYATRAVEVLNDRTLMEHFLRGQGKPFTITNYRDLLRRVRESSYCYLWWIYVDESFAGLAGLAEIGQNENIGHPSGKVFYVVKREFQRRGVATAVVKSIVNFAFDEISLTAVEAEVKSTNIPGLFFAQKLGFSHRYTDRHDRNYVWHGFCLKTL